MLDEITLAVAKAVTSEVGLPYAEVPTIQSTDNTEAWLLYSRAGFHFDQISREDNTKAIDLLRQVIEIDPNWSSPYALLAVALQMKARFRWTKSPEETVGQAIEMAQKAIKLDESNPFAYGVYGELYLNQRKYDEAIDEAKKSIDLDLNWDEAHWRMARILNFAGQNKEALPYIKEAMRLNPHYPWTYAMVSGRIYYHSGRYEEALAEFENVFEICSRGDCWMYFPHIYLSMVYGKLGRDTEAQQHMDKVIEENPRFNLESRSKVSLFKNKEDTDREIDGLRKAGAPEYPPS
jgi:adenylate cyclase